jgi:hypothetical protein
VNLYFSRFIAYEGNAYMWVMYIIYVKYLHAEFMKRFVRRVADDLTCFMLYSGTSIVLDCAFVPLYATKKVFWAF